MSTVVSPPTPLSLLERVRGGDQDAWRRLLAIYEPLIRQWLRRAAPQAGDLDDLAQQILTVLVRKLPAFRHSGRPGAFRAWLRRVCVCELHDFRRRRASFPSLHDAEALDRRLAPTDDLLRAWDEEYDRHVLGGLLRLVRGDFTATTWRAFRRVALDGAAPRDVAAELGLSVNAVTVAKTRVLRRLRQEASGLTE
jgi:RNA polymerase sigma-70 factor (ECF subfamily)